jgi:hypothetical protein
MRLPLAPIGLEVVGKSTGKLLGAIALRGGYRCGLRGCPVLRKVSIFVSGFAIEGGGLLPEFFGFVMVESRRKAVIKFNYCASVR